MKELRALLVVLVVVGIGVFASGTATAASKPMALTADQIDAALVTFPELPAEPGLAAPPPMPTITSLTAIQTDSICNGPNEAALGQAAGYQSVGVQVLAQPSTSDGPFPSEALYAFPSVQTAKKFTQTYGHEGDSCHNAWMASPFGRPDEGYAPIAWTLKNVKPPKLGDQLFGFQVLGQDPEVGQRINEVLVVRLGNHVVVMGRSGLAKVMTDSSARIAASAKIAVAKLKTAVQKATKT
jgi:hypothetical protein